MIKSIDIVNFKSIKEIRIENFTKLNVFIGGANSGKTSILEALHLYLSKDPYSLGDILTYRQTNSYNCFSGIFNNFNQKEGIKIIEKNRYRFNGFIYESTLGRLIIKINNEAIKTIDRGGKDLSNIINNQINSSPSELNLSYSYGSNFARDVVISLQGDINSNALIFNYRLTYKNGGYLYLKENIFLSEFIPSDTIIDYKFRQNFLKIFVNVERRNKLLEYIKVIFNDIKGIYQIGDSLMVEVAGINSLIDIKQMGQGFQKFLYIIVSIVIGNRFIIIDEIENGLHYDAIEYILKLIFKVRNIQFFITTHSKEILNKLHKFILSSDNIGIYNVFKDKYSFTKCIEISKNDFISNMKMDNEIRD